MVYPTPRCAGCAHNPHDILGVCGEADESGRNGATCNCRACSRCGHTHEAGQACTWKITDTSNCGCYGPTNTPAAPGPRYPANGLEPNVARGVLELIDKHATAGTRLLPLLKYEGAEVPWPVVRMVVDLALRGDRLGDVPRLTHCGIPVPWALVPNWDQLEVSWWRRGVEAARDYEGADFDA